MSDFITPPINEAEKEKFFQELCRILNKKTPVIPANSTAADIATMVTDFNALLANLRTAFE